MRKVREVNERVSMAIKRVEDAEAKSIRAVELWGSSSEFDSLVQDAYVVALEEVVKHIYSERPRFDVAFLEKVVEEQKKELQQLTEEARVRIFPTIEDDDAAPRGPPLSSQASLPYIFFGCSRFPFDVMNLESCLKTFCNDCVSTW